VRLRIGRKGRCFFFKKEGNIGGEGADEVLKKTKNKKETSNSQDKLVKKASAVENLAAAHQRVVPSHSHGV
jgi:hypothetical protein